MSAPQTTPGRGTGLDARRVPRELHPVAWWLWAIGLIVAVNRTTNPLLLLLTLSVLGFVVASRRGSAPWARAFRYYLMLAGFVIVLRLLFRTVFPSGVTPTDHILFRLPRIPTPSWYRGVQIGGPVTLEATLSASVDGLRLGTMLCCIGAANALANPKRALRVLPGALYELGMAVAVAVTLAPQLIESVQRVARARRLRGGAGRRVHALRSIVVPVLADALERALMLAAAMDSRGYGRSGDASPRARRVTGGLMLAGLIGLCLGAYGLLDATVPRVLGAPVLLAGAAVCCAGLALGGRRVRRTRYRPDPWRGPEWTVALCGIASAVLLYVSAGYSAAAVDPTFYPLRFPPLPALPAIAILIAAIPALAAPPPIRSRRHTTAPDAGTEPSPRTELVA
ncbi:MAG TPA: energy-coupling factor transporter transmembrane component T [Solirubrobacteraceae bacterium]|nr:energy-coupling factor transporter transmembrane component T [Solirubrobacteraceae bacterium]